MHSLQEAKGSKKVSIRRTKDGLRVKVGQVEEFKETPDGSWDFPTPKADTDGKRRKAAVCCGDVERQIDKILQIFCKWFKWLCKSQCSWLRQALGFLDIMRYESLKPTAVLHGVVIGSCIKSNQLEAGSRWFSLPRDFYGFTCWRIRIVCLSLLWNFEGVQHLTNAMNIYVFLVWKWAHERHFSVPIHVTRKVGASWDHQ